MPKTKKVNLTRTSITLDPKTYKKGLARAAKRGFQNSFSAYLARLIEEDATR